MHTPENKISLNLKGLLFTKYLWGGYALILVSLGTVLAILAWYGQSRFEESATAETHSIAVALDELNRRQIQTMAIPLEYMSFQMHRREGVDQFSANELHRFFEFIKTALPSTGVRDLFAVDRNGNVVSSSHPVSFQGARTNYRGHPEFEYVKTQKNTTVISSSIAADDGRRLLVLMKSLHTANGRFAGIVGVTRTFDDFEKFYQSLQPRFPVNFAMLRDDGKVLYHYPKEKVNDSAHFKLPRDLEGDRPGVVSLRNSNLDDNVGAYYKFGSSYGTTIYVSYDPQNVFSAWHRVLKIGLFLYLSFMVALAVLIKVAHRRQKLVESVVEHHRHRDELVERIQQPTESLTGSDFLKVFISTLSDVFQIDNAVVGFLLPEHTDSVKCVVHYVHGEYAPEQIYPLRGTPFAELTPGEHFVYSKSVSRIYPDDSLLGHRDIQSAIGFVLQNQNAEAVGILMIYSESEMVETSLKRSILASFAARIGAELQRVHSDELKKEVQGLRRQIEDRALQSQKIEAIGNLAEGLAHDFNSLLAVMLASTEKLITVHKDSEQDLHYLESIKKACHRARHLVSQIMVYSQKEDSQLQAVKLKPLMTDALSFLNTILPDNIKATVEDGECNQVEVNADVDQLQQALMNLCVNASKTIGSGGGEIRITLQKNRIKGRMYVKCIVHHSGNEIGREEIEKIFDPFYAQNIGMLVVQRIITSHKGFIEVKSEAGQGTSYEIFLPVVEAEAASEKRKIVNLKTEQRVLIVDDEPEIGYLIKELLEIEGLRVDAETDPVKALAQFRENPDRYFMIISDLAMPEMSGFEFCRSARAVHRLIPLILWSGYYQYLDEELQDLNVRVLSKPVDVQKLLQMINAEVSQQSSQDTSVAAVGLGTSPSALT